MQRIPIHPDLLRFPEIFRPFLENAPLYDSSSSKDARVIFIDKDGGFYLKSASGGTLRTEAEMTRFFNEKGLAPKVLFYVSGERDFLLTARALGEDCTDNQYLEDPVRLCDTLAELLRKLHATDTAGCPVPDRTAGYMATAEKNYREGRFDRSLFPDNWGYSSPEAAWSVVERCREQRLFRSDTLLHGDFCLPNVQLNDWRFSAFIDVGNGGVGDRHIDLFWALWSLSFNLKTDRYSKRFLDAYGRDRVDPEMLRVVAAHEVFG